MFSCRLFLLLVLFNTNIKGQDIFGTIPASAGTWSSGYLSPFAAVFNPAALGQSIPASLAIKSMQPFFIKGLSEIQCYAVIPLVDETGLFFGFRRFGSIDYTELSLSVGYGLQLKKWLLLGANIHNTTSKIKGIGRSGTIIPAMSLQFLTKSFTSGVFIHYQPKAQSLKLPHYVLIGLGIGKDWSSQLYTDLNLCYGTGTKINTQVSMQYQVLSSWQLVLKIQTRPLNYAFETGYTKNQLSIRICSDWHPQLGFSPGLFLGYSFKPDKHPDEEGNLY